MEDSKLLEDARQHQNETDTNGSDQEVKGLRGRTGTNTVSLITQEDFNFEGTTIETADIIIAKCNNYDKAIDGAKLLVAVERGRAYAYAKITLKTNVAVAARYKTSEKSVKNYITTFNGREILKTEGVPDSTGINKLVGIVNVGKAKARVESMDLDLDLENYTDAEIIKAAKLSKCDVVDFLEAEVEEDEGEVYVELGTVEEPEPVATTARTATDIFKELTPSDKVIMFNHIHSLENSHTEDERVIADKLSEKYAKEIIEKLSTGSDVSDIVTEIYEFDSETNYGFVELVAEDLMTYNSLDIEYEGSTDLRDVVAASIVAQEKEDLEDISKEHGDMVDIMQLAVSKYSLEKVAAGVKLKATTITKLINDWNEKSKWNYSATGYEKVKDWFNVEISKEAVAMNDYESRALFINDFSLEDVAQGKHGMNLWVTHEVLRFIAGIEPKSKRIFLPMEGK